MASNTTPHAPFRSTPIPPVSKLTEDILWLIFMVNTENSHSYDPEKEESSDLDWQPLNTTRISSQVCRQWRHVLLKTSSVWARLLDWRSLNQEADDWRDEVLRRTGTSLLWIGGYDENEEPKDSTLLFFHRLVVEHWERIEKLMPFPSQYEHIEGLQHVIRRPAPNLAVFTFPDSPRDYHEFEGLMFAGHSPRLKVFHAMGTRCNLDPIWMSNLRELCLGSLFNNKNVCPVLAQLPRLESLELDSHTIIDGYQSPSIHLPKLRALKIWGCIRYLVDIQNPPVGCALSLWGELQVDFPDCYKQSIAKLIHNSLSIYPTKRVYLECRASIFTLTGRQSYHAGNRDQKEDVFDITLCPDLSSSNNVVKGLLSTLASPLFATVVELTVSFDVLESIGRSEELKKFISYFSAVESLSLHESDIPMLLEDMEMGGSDALIFPRLRTIIVLGLSLSDSKKCWHDPLYQYLLHRRARGAPITTIDLTQYCEGEIPQTYLDSLDAFAGMIVQWKQNGVVRKYECGSGHPEDLCKLGI